MRSIMTCLICKIEFEFKVRSDRKRQFCSHACKKKFSRKILTTCKICGEKKYRSPCKLNYKTCSMKCRNISMRYENGGPLAFNFHATKEQKLSRLKCLFDSKVIKGEGCWGWIASMDKDGYGNMMYNRKGIRAHRASWMIHFGDIPEGLWVLHKCDNPTCANPKHLFLGSAKDNNHDMIKKGRNVMPSGENHWGSKLNSLDVSKIKKLLSQGLPQDKIAHMFNVAQATIWRIKAGISYRSPIDE
jgi:hypothetical protein